MKLVFQG